MASKRLFASVGLQIEDLREDAALLLPSPRLPRYIKTIIFSVTESQSDNAKPRRVVAHSAEFSILEAFQFRDVVAVAGDSGANPVPVRNMTSYLFLGHILDARLPSLSHLEITSTTGLDAALCEKLRALPPGLKTFLLTTHSDHAATFLFPDEHNPWTFSPTVEHLRLHIPIGNYARIMALHLLSDTSFPILQRLELIDAVPSNPRDQAFYDNSIAPIPPRTHTLRSIHLEHITWWQLLVFCQFPTKEVSLARCSVRGVLPACRICWGWYGSERAEHPERFGVDVGMAGLDDSLRAEERQAGVEYGPPTVEVKADMTVYGSCQASSCSWCIHGGLQ